MHVADMIYEHMFRVELGESVGKISDVFPEWTVADRFGILIDSPLGGLGATNLIQIAMAAFYDCKPARRKERKIYPEVYAFHIGRDFGAFTAFDFWPARREIVVSTDHREVLDAINDRAITRLAIPSRPARALEHRPKEVDAALENLKSAFMYNSLGRVPNPDFAIIGIDRQTEHNPRRVIRPPNLTAATAQTMAASGSKSKETEPEYRTVIKRRFNAVTAEERSIAERARSSLLDQFGIRETYRFIEPRVALNCL
ncbi:hypothetical protein EN833_13445 [Mesorhizobium sp. M4B.F.Ca.ET.190.01.1.1]|uniref:hypothetical protein n=1 Tax=unclassified Mesorhizobium TaxID=325217 RepID=UPI00109302E7|nr:MULTISPECIES: hypothetical protein [unclassified Mesorhizobium]TGR10529.1 hypothetical protein EN843_13440 [Mesorhizobium sp. M4B.F.Ca.ET.200.01.1.1]TGS19619.1 hypothetical protein EN833_13445 [Mesorhizobium sp. M4B.F.Ca.ET.190.01.1.1]TGT32415.1 hypothetical protein EN815_07990 [Mesorhizobium sp. M4B.F.Ca.ET.172.01.1.1]